MALADGQEAASPRSDSRCQNTFAIGERRSASRSQDLAQVTFRKVIEERKGKKKSDPLYYFLKILANAGCYGIYAEVNRHQVGKNDAKQVGIFSGEANISERATIMERPGPFYFPPVSALITAGGRLLLPML